MYLLDTNVISEIRKGTKSDVNVTSWAKSASTSSLFLSVITILELETGVLLKERQDPSQGATLRTWLNIHVLPVFSERILYIDVAVAAALRKITYSRSKIRAGCINSSNCLSAWYDPCH